MANRELGNFANNFVAGLIANQQQQAFQRQQQQQRQQQIGDILSLGRFAQAQAANQGSVAQNMALLNQIRNLPPEQQAQLPQNIAPQFNVPAPAPFVPQTLAGAQGLLDLTLSQLPGQGDPFTLTPGQARFTPGGQQIAALPAEQDPFTLTPGQTRFDQFGNIVAQAQAKPTTFEQEKSEIQRLGAIPKAQRTPVQQRRLDQLLDVPVTAPKKPSTSFQQLPDPADPTKTINALVNSDTGDIIKNFGSTTQGLSPKDKTTIAVAQAKEFRADERIKNLQIVERSERGMAAALKKATSPDEKSRIASDQALGVLFQKMLDPTSVVRESEFARTPEGASMINRITSIAPHLARGGLRLTNEDRQALADMASALLLEAKRTANKAFSEFETRADEIGLNKKIVFGGAKPFDLPDIPPLTGGNGRSVQDLTDAELEAAILQGTQ
jgi:hypothetical protein